MTGTDQTLPTPEDAVARLAGLGEDGAAALVRAMAAELAAVRQERDTLAEFTRSIAGLSGAGTSHNATLVVSGTRALDALRVTRRCPDPVRPDGEHRWMRDHGWGSRCFSCHALRPDPR
jgi:hypothetical protein